MADDLFAFTVFGLLVSTIFPTTNSDLSPFFTVNTNVERWNKWMFDTSKPTSGFYPSAENWTEFTGLGPTYWAVEFQKYQHYGKYVSILF